MKQSSLLLLASCVSPTLAWTEWEDLFPDPSIEVYKGLEASAPVSELLGQSSSELTSWLPAGDDSDFDESDPSGIFARQSKCRPGSYPCSAGGCCRTGTNCVPGGCCLGTKTACGPKGCVDLTKEVCCGSDSTVCPKGYNCVSTGCCESGLKPCGSKGCYDPKSEVCCAARGSRGTTCPKGYDCMEEGGCCPSGMLGCGASKCYDPKIRVCCDDEKGSIWTCKRGSQCCIAGKTCFNPPSERCCTVGACPAEEKCCGKECCAPGFSCTKKTGRCKPKKPRPSKAKTTTTKTRCTTPTPDSPQGTSTQTITFTHVPKREVTNMLNSSEKVNISNKAVLMNMCRGIRQLTGKTDGKMVLTHGGEECEGANRGIMCPEDWCKKAANEYIDLFFPKGTDIPSWAQAAIDAVGGMGCDEFPFASSVEGGDLKDGSRVCVPRDDNNWQGTTMSKHFRGKDRIQKGHKYAIQIEGWDCNKQQPTSSFSALRLRELGSTYLQKRDAFDGEGVFRLGGEMYRGYDSSNPALNLMPMPLGDLAAGTYTVHLNVTKGNLSYEVMNYVGRSVEADINDDGSITFTLEEDWIEVGLAGTTEDDDVELSYKAEKAEPGATTATAGPTPVPTDGSGASGLGPGTTPVFLMIAYLFTVFLF